MKDQEIVNLKQILKETLESELDSFQTPMSSIGIESKQISEFKEEEEPKKLCPELYQYPQRNFTSENEVIYLREWFCILICCLRRFQCRILILGHQLWIISRA